MNKKEFDALRAEFPPEEVLQRPGGGGKMLDYVPIETFLNRLLDVAPDYNLTAWHFSLEGNTATAGVRLVIGGKTAVGVGSMTNADKDMAAKSALSEAIKNAAKNGWGMSLYLWDEKERAKLAEWRQRNRRKARTQGVSPSSSGLPYTWNDSELEEF